MKKPDVQVTKIEPDLFIYALKTTLASNWADKNAKRFERDLNGDLLVKQVNSGPLIDRMVQAGLRVI
jgi:hypothetical protein